MSDQEEKSSAQKIRKWFQDNPIARGIVSGTIESVPMIGPVIRNVFDNSTEPEDVKINQIIQILKNLEQLDDSKLEYISNQIVENKNEILKNQEYLQQFVTFVSDMNNKINQFQDKLEVGSIKIQLDVVKLHLEVFESKGEIIKKIDEIYPTIQNIPTYTHRIMITPMIISAIKLGETIAVKGQHANAIEIYAEGLGVASIYKESDVNNMQRLLDALQARHGKIVSESFLLGRQLVLLTTARPEAVNASMKLLLSRLQLVLHDIEIVLMIKKTLDKWINGRFGDGIISRYFLFIIKLLYEEIVYPDNKYLIALKNASLAETKEELLLTMPGIDITEKKLLISLFKKIKEHGIDDPTMDLFIGLAEDNLELFNSGIDRGGDPNTSDGQLISKYYNLLNKIAPKEFLEYRKLDYPDTLF